MKYNKLSNTDIEVSEICLGTMTFGEQNSESEAHEQMDLALDMGVNFFDTAELYAVPSTPENNGKTEDFIGTWFAKSGKRDHVCPSGPNPNNAISNLPLVCLLRLSTSLDSYSLAIESVLPSKRL